MIKHTFANIIRLIYNYGNCILVIFGKTIIMNKKLLIGALLLSSVFTLNAQTIVWSDNFNDENISDWQLIDADGDGNDWGDQWVITDEEQNPVTPVSLISRSWLDDPLTPDNWAISPAINLINTSGNIMLTWKVQAAAAEWDEENYTVYAATANSTTALQASPVQFNEIYPGTGAGEVFTRTLDLSSFAGQTVYIAFRHHNTTNMDFISIDDVAVSAETLGMNDHIASQFLVFPNPATDIITVSNTNNILVSNITIGDTNGRRVSSLSFEPVQEAQVNISVLASGIYVMNIVTDKGVITRKVVKN